MKGPQHWVQPACCIQHTPVLGLAQGVCCLWNVGWTQHCWQHRRSVWGGADSLDPTHSTGDSVPGPACAPQVVDSPYQPWRLHKVSPRAGTSCMRRMGLYWLCALHVAQGVSTGSMLHMVLSQSGLVYCLHAVCQPPVPNTVHVASSAQSAAYNMCQPQGTCYLGQTGWIWYCTWHRRPSAGCMQLPGPTPCAACNMGSVRSSLHAARKAGRGLAHGVRQQSTDLFIWLHGLCLTPLH